MSVVKKTVHVGFDNSISVMRVSAMIMIVLYHCLAYNIGNWIEFGETRTYSSFVSAAIHNVAYVALDAFVFISGLLYCRIGATGRYDDTSGFLSNKAKRLLAPYLIWGILLCLVFYGRCHPMDLLGGILHLWFLLMLFEVFVIAALSKKFWQKLSLKSSILVMILLVPLESVFVKSWLLATGGQSDVPLLGLPATLGYLPVFYFGIITEKFKLYRKINISNRVACTLMVALFAVGAVPYLVHLPLHWLYQWLPTYLLVLLAYKSLDGLKIKTGGVKVAVSSCFWTNTVSQYTLSITSWSSPFSTISRMGKRI